MLTFTVSTRWHHPLDIVAEFKAFNRLDQLKRVYGFLFDSPLNGGRLRKACIRFPFEVIDELNALGIGYSFTLSNLTVAQEHLEDPHTNRILKRYENPLNGVIVAHDRVGDYIRRHYPAYRLRASCIYNFLSADEINRACERFDEVCVFPEVNDQAEVLEAIEQKQKVVPFGTSLCLNRCGSVRLHHYYIIGQDHIAWYNHKKYHTPYRPDDFEHPYMPWCQADKSVPRLQDMEKLHAMGFTTFKITQFEIFKSCCLRGEPLIEANWRKRYLAVARQHETWPAKMRARTRRFFRERRGRSDEA